MKIGKRLVAAFTTALMLMAFFAGSIYVNAQELGSSSSALEDNPASAISSVGQSSLPQQSPPASSSSLPPVPGPGSSLPAALPAPSLPQNTSQAPVGIMPTATNYTVRFFDWDSSLLIPPQSVEAGQSATAPANPTRADFKFTGWSAPYTNVTTNLDIYALYIPLVKHYITINYIYANSTKAAEPYVVEVAGGDDYNEIKASHTISGYLADEPNVNIALTNIQQDYTYTVVYTPDGATEYKVEHYLQNLALSTNLADYQKMDASTQNLFGKTGALVAAAPLFYPGFSPPSHMPTAQIAGDDSTVLKVYYSRNQYAVYFNAAGGDYIAPIGGAFGAAISPPTTPSRLGYAFLGWSAPLPSNMPANDVNLTALWTPLNNVSYTRVFWLENTTSTGYDYVGTNVVTNSTAGSAPSLPTSLPSGVTFPIANTYFDINTPKSSLELPGAINGDGSTIVNVYYDRKEYDLNFTFDASKYRLTVGGTVYTASPYVLRAKFGAPISAKWPGTPTLLPGKNGDGTFVGWTGSSIQYVTIQYYLDANLITNRPFTALWDPASKLITVNYLLPNLSGVGTTNPYSQVVAVKTTSSTWNAKSFVGFTAVASPVNIAQDNTATFTYTRNKYSITYYNSNTVFANKATVPYQTSLAGAEYAGLVPTLPAGLPQNYQFGGWYTTPQGYENSKFNFANATMPAYNLILYAKWVKPVYTVTFNPNNGDAPFSQSLPGLDTLAEPSAPTKPGFEFAGWYRDGAALKYMFNFPVDAGFTLTAKWLPTNNISYTVLHMQGVLEHTRLSFGGKSVGDAVLANAIDISGYRPDAVEKSLTLAPSGNQIVFNYSPIANVGYTVRYVNAANGNVLYPEKTATANSSTAFVTENYVNLPGFYPDYYQKTLQLTPVEANNVITFYYTQNLPAKYTVRTYLETINGGYIYTEEIKYSPLGSTVTEPTPDIEGFDYKPLLSTNGRVVTAGGATIIRLYYNRKTQNISFAAGLNGALAGAVNFTNIKYQTPFSSAVTLPNPVPNAGYMFAGWFPALPAPASEVTQDASYVANFEKDPLKWGVISYHANLGQGTMANSPETLLGENFALPPNGFTFTNKVFTGWNTHPSGSGTDYAPNTTIAFPGTTVLYAQWVDDTKFALTYLAGGGAGTMPTEFIFKNNNAIPIANAFVRPGYTFTSWQDQDANTRAVGAPFAMTKNMYLSAQWALNPADWSQITFDANLPSGTLTGAVPTVPAVLKGQAFSIPAATFSLENYTFTGWSTAPNGSGTNYADGDTMPGADVSAASISLFAQWRENPKATLKYDANLGLGTVASSGPHYAGQVATVATNGFTRLNHDFVRWSTAPDGSGTGYLPASTITIMGEMAAEGGTDIILYAIWQERKSFETTYSDGFTQPPVWSSPTTFYVDADGTKDIVVGANSYSRNGYEFTSWYTNTQDPLVPSIYALEGQTLYDISENTSFTAQWRALVYALNIALDGGTVSGAQNPSNYTIETPTFSLNNPSKPGHTFGGWSGTGIATTSLNVAVPMGTTGILNYTANWDIINYALVYELDGGTLVNPNPATYNINSPQITLNNPSKTGYDFTGWTKTGQTSPVPLLVIPAGSTGGATYTANYAPKNYTIGYTLNGGSTATDNPITVNIESPPFTLVNPTRPGYRFEGWSGTNIAGQVQSHTVPAGTAENLSFVANWALETYYINYTLYGGTLSSPNPTQYTKDTPNFTLNNPAKANYIFIGWSGTGIAFVDANKTIASGSSGDLNFTARYLPIPHRINYELDGGSLSVQNPTKFDIETPNFTLNNPTKPGYIFAGWTGTDLAAPSKTVLISALNLKELSFAANWQYDQSQWAQIAFESQDKNQGILQGTAVFSGVKGSATSANVVLPHPQPAAGYRFKGWSTPLPSNYPNQDLIITALWEHIPSASQSTDQGGTVPAVSSSSRRSSPTSKRASSSHALQSGSSSALSSSSQSAFSLNSGTNAVSSSVLSDVSKLPDPNSLAASAVAASGTIAAENPNTSSIFGQGTPFAQFFAVRAHWALLNLLCAVASIVGALVLLLRRSKKPQNVGQDENQEKARQKGRAFRWESVLAGALAPIVFLLTEDFTKKMVLLDGWTIVMLAILAAEFLLARHYRKLNQKNTQAAN